MLGKTAQRIRLLVIGDGDMRQTMESEFRLAGIDYAYYPQEPRHAQAICISWQTEMDEVLAGLDIVALTSHNEGTPVSLIEAQAAGRPVVSTDVGGVADVVENGVTGFVTPAGDADAFADALLKLTEHENVRSAFAAAGSAAVKTRFSYQRLVGDMDGYYRMLLSRK
jgi:glycosyltransferase involved in cell wall biosynthesis